MFLSAAVIKPYHSILYLDKGRPNRYLDLRDMRLGNAAQCQQQPSVVLLRNGPHKIVTLNAHTYVVVPVVDLTSERKRIDHKQEGMALAMASETLMYAIYRTHDDCLRLARFSTDIRLPKQSIDLGEIYRNLIAS
jgi:hypothetical protein